MDNKKINTMIHGCIISLMLFFITAAFCDEHDWHRFFKASMVSAKKLQGDILLDNPFYTLEIEGEVEQPFLVRGFNFRQEDKEIHKGHHAFPAAPFIATMFTHIDNEKLQVLFAAKLPVSVKNILPEYLKASDHERDAVYNIVIQGAPGCQSDQPPVEIADTNSMVRRHTAGLKTQPYFLSKQCPDDTELPDPPPIINSLGDQLNLPSHSIQFLDTNNYFLKQYIPAMAETRMMGPKVDSPYLRWSNSKLFFSHTLASCIGHGQSFDVVKQLWNQNSAFWSKMIPKNQPYAPVYTLHILIQGTGDGLTVDKVLTYLKDLDDQQLSIRFFWDCLKQVCEDDARSIEVLSALDPVMNAFLVCPNCGDSQTIYAANQSGETLVECFKCNTKLCLSCKRSHQEPCGVYFDNLSDDEKKEYIGKVYGVPVTSLITAENDGLVCDSCFTNPELDEKVVPMTCGTHYLCIDCVKGGCSGSPIADLRKSDNDAAGLPMLYFHCPGDTTNGAGAGPACTGRLPDKLNNQLLAEKITKEEHRLAVLAEGGVHCPGGCEDLILAEDVGGIKRRNKRGTPYICRNKDCPSLQVSASVQNMMVQYQYMAKEALSKYHELNVGIRALDLGLISDEDKVNLLQGFRHSCLNCDVTPYHHGKTCGQYQRDKALSEADVEVKYCPKRSCGVPIQKNEGCSHMVCSQCHYSFCWFCGQKWTGTNSTRSRCSKSSANPNGCPWLPHEIKAYEAARRGEVAPEPAAVDPSEYEEETDAAIREALGEGDAAEQARILRMIQEEANRR